MSTGFWRRFISGRWSLNFGDAGSRPSPRPRSRVLYKGTEVGFYKADLWVDECVIVELKVARSLNPEDEAQLLNELKATGVKVGLLIDFGRTKVEFKRMVF